MGRNGERRRLNVVRWGREEWGVLDMNPEIHGGMFLLRSRGDRMRGSECRQW